MSKKIYLLELIFKIWFLVYTMMSVCSLFYGQSIISFVMWPMMFLGAVLVLYRLIHYKGYVSMPGTVWLVAMCVSAFITLVVNHNYALKDNIVNLVLWGFYFFILYVREKNEEFGNVKKEFDLLGYVYVGYSMLGFLGSFVMMGMRYYRVYIDARGNEAVFGYVWGRLWGVFVDPNFPAVMATVAICFVLYFLKSCEKKYQKLLCYLSILISILYISFSDSRTGRVSLVCVVLFYGIAWICHEKKNQKTRMKLLYFSVILLMSITAFFIPKGIQNGYNALASRQGGSADVGDRKYDMSGDVSNRRLDIWESGIELFADSPVVGTSFGGMVEYAEENLPDTYIVNNDYKLFYSLDNEWLNMLMAQGVLGIVTLLGFVITILIHIMKNLFYLENEEYQVASIGFVMIISITASTLFRAAMLYNSTPNSNIFWSILGIVVLICNGKKKAKEKMYV